MKKTITSICLLIILSACNSTSKEYQKQPPDTLQTAAIYLDAGTVNGGMVYRVTKDTSYLDTTNADNVKLKWRRDTIYYIPSLTRMRDSANNIIIDSATGKPRMTTIYVPMANKKHMLQDFNKTY